MQSPGDMPAQIIQVSAFLMNFLAPSFYVSRTGRVGRRTTHRAPWPPVESKKIEPPDRSITSLAMESPKPVPWLATVSRFAPV